MTAIHSRRSIIAGLAAAPVLSIPAAAGTIGGAPGLEGPDRVIRLCAAFREIDDYFHSRMERAREIRDRVNADMPPPDPSIVHGPEAEALGIKTPEDFGVGHRLPHNAIEPSYIETALYYVQPIDLRYTEGLLPDGKIVRTFVELDKPEFRSDEVKAKHEKLTRLLALSQEYLAEHMRRLTAAGYDDDEDESERVTDELAHRQHVLTRALRITPARTREALLAKIDLYESNPAWFESDTDFCESILRDVRRLLAH